jgi:hypothetical protein
MQPADVHNLTCNLHPVPCTDRAYCRMTLALQSGHLNSRGGTFFELQTTAYGVITVRLMGGFNF